MLKVIHLSWKCSDRCEFVTKCANCWLGGVIRIGGLLTICALADRKEGRPRTYWLATETEGPGRWLASFAWWKVRARAGLYVTCARYGSCQTSTKLCNSLLYDENNSHVLFLDSWRTLLSTPTDALCCRVPSSDSSAFVAVGRWEKRARHVSCEVAEIQIFPAGEIPLFPFNYGTLRKSFGH